MENNYQKFTKDVLIIGFANLLNASSGIIFLPLITKILGAGNYGIWVQVQAITSLVMSFVGLGLPYALNRFLAGKKDMVEIQEEFWSVLTIVSLVTLSASIIMIAAAGFIAQAFFEGSTNVVRISGLIILISSLNIVLLNFFRAFRQMKKFALFSIISTYGQLGLITYLVLNGHGIFSMVMAVLIVNILIFLSSLLIVTRQIGVKKPHFLRLKNYLNFGLPTIPGNISSWVVYSSDRFVIAYFLGATSVGIYSAAYSLGSLPALIVTILGLVLPPTLSGLYDAGKIHELKMHLSYSMKYALLLAIPFVFGAIFMASPVLRIFSTPEIADRGRIILIFESINSLVLVAGGVINEILVPVKKTKISGMSWLIGAAANLGLNLSIVPHIGIIGAAISTLVSYLVVEAIQVYYSLKYIKFDIDWSFIIKSLVASGIMSIVIWVMRPEGFSTTILTIIIGIMVYSVSLVILRAFTKEEFSFFQGLLLQQLSKPRKDKIG